MKGAFSGTRAWLLQRLSALYLLGFTVFVLVRLAAGAPHSYETWREWMTSGGTSAAVLLFFVALLLHAWVGVRDVVMDYVHPFALRLIVLGLLAAGETAIGIWAAMIFVQVK